MAWCRALALDLDGTLTQSGPPDDSVLARLAELRAGGLRLILVTGRILRELQTEMPGVVDSFDLVVAENGCLLHSPRGTRHLADPVSPALSDWLITRGVPVRRGEVILAGTASDDHRVLDGVDALHLEVRLVRNRSELMVLPAGVSKGTGLQAALRELGVSHHNVVAVGDAENDLSMLAAAEFSVAVANAVESVRHDADVALLHPDGQGLMELLRRDVLDHDSPVASDRRQIVLGDGDDGCAVTIPAQTTVLIKGNSESGKSFLAGLMVEQLVALEYSLLIIDPEGDHVCLGSVPGVLVVSAPDLPAPVTLLELYALGVIAVVLDLSASSVVARERYLDLLWPHLVEHRMLTSTPHWVVVEEAQNLNTCRQVVPRWWRGSGLCLVTYRPDLLPPSVVASMAWQLEASAEVPARLEAVGGESREFRPANRWTHHVRHLHKYADAPLPAMSRFVFTVEGRPVGSTVGTLREFVEVLAQVPESVIVGHARRGDFSRWLDDQYRDRVAASLIRAAERDLVAHGDSDRTRRQICDIVDQRYLSDLPPPSQPRPVPPRDGH
jgi:hydroxymethylpyrimidine pyrophosphatase-like HAD family hydrolase